MKKIYEKPEIEMISLAAMEAVTAETDDDNSGYLLEGEMGLSSSIFD